MSGYETVLVAIDLHGSPEQVLARATSLVEGHSSTIHVLSVSADPSYLYTTYPVFASTTLEFDWDRQREDTLTQMRGLTEQAGLFHSNIIAEIGSATYVILETAQQLEADLIIVGSHGRRGVRRLLGSTANGVLHRAGCDVLAVRIDDSANSATE